VSRSRGPPASRGRSSRGDFGDVDFLVPPAIVAVRGQGALDNDVVSCQLAKVVVLERPDAPSRGELEWGRGLTWRKDAGFGVI
jgi:hypothetical protein